MDRLVGVDVTRGVAVLGMFAAHLGGPALALDEPGGWLVVTQGRSAATFAMLAGLSAALLSGGPEPTVPLGPARIRIGVRAALLGVLGVALTALGTPVAVILPGYALMLLMLLPVLGVRRRALLHLAATTLAVGPLVWALARDLAVPGTGLLVGPYYPAVVWFTYLLVGLAVGRSDLRSTAVRVRLAQLGGACAVVGYGTGVLAGRVLAPDRTLWRAVLEEQPHSNGAPEVLGNLGVTLLLLVAMLVVAERAPRLVTPLAATGALALTAYCGHLVAIAVLGPAVVRDPDPLTLTGFVVVTLVACTLWRTSLGRGPLERVLHRASTRAGALVNAPA